MWPEGSCRKVGVIYNEVALPSIKMHNMHPPWRYDSAVPSRAKLPAGSRLPAGTTTAGSRSSSRGPAG